MVNQVWGKHSTVVTGTNDDSKQVSKNEWNENLNRKGLLGFDAETIASGASVTIPDDSSNDVSSFIKLSGSTSVDTIVQTNTSEGDLLYIITTGTVTLNDATGNIHLLGDANKDLSTTVPTILMRIGSAWYEYGGQLNSSHSVSANDLTGTTLASGVVTSSLTTVGTIGSGTWQGTAVADSYLGTGISALKLADGTVTNTELQYINTLSSNAQTQLDAKQATLTFGIANTNVTKAGTGIVDDDFIRVDGTTFEGRSASEVLSDIGAQASLTFGISDGNVAKCNDAVADNDFLRIDGTEIEGRTASEVLSDIGGQASLTFGIADTNKVQIDGSGTATGEYAKFTATGIIGEEVADVKTDLSLNNVENTALSTWAGTTNVTTLGTITSGTWTGTAIADANLGTGINATKLADGTVTNAELQYINTLSSNAQTQLDGKSATAGNGSLVTVGALDSGSITSNFGTINNGSSTITTTGALASGAITTSGTLTMGDNIITGIHSLDTDVDTVAYAATVDLDFTDNEEIILGELTGNIEFTDSNNALGKHKTIHMDSDGSARTFTFPAGWVFYGDKPTETTADKKSCLSLTCLGSAEADVRAVFAEEG